MTARAIRIFALAVLLLQAGAVAFAGDKKISFTAERMSGTAAKKNGKTTLEGKASVTVGTLTISGDSIELSGKDFRFIAASGNVSGNDSEKGYSFTADLLSYDREVEVASFRGNAKLIDTKNEVESSAAIITYNQKTEVAFLQIDVKLKRKTIDCSSGFALYRRSLSTLELTGAPSVLRDGDEFSADRISVDLETERITLDGAVTGKLKDSSKTKDEQAAETGTAPVDADGKATAATEETAKPEETTKPEETAKPEESAKNGDAAKTQAAEVPGVDVTPKKKRIN